MTATTTMNVSSDPKALKGIYYHLNNSYTQRQMTNTQVRSPGTIYPLSDADT
jgi:hypothetical protein